MPVHINLQPKQAEMLDLIENSKARVIGVGGGRGAAKSTGIDNCALTLALETPKTLIAVVMRNFDQVYRYHIEPLVRAYPDIKDWVRYSSPSKVLIPNGSQIDYTYAESLADIERRFRSANYKYIFIDQAEQFTGNELREIMLANRGAKGAKTVLSFNMGGIGIGDLRDWFGPAPKFNERDDPANYKFLHVYPWDNVVWALPALTEEGLDETEYYSWTDKERFEYFVRYTEYGRQLNALDDAIRNRDLMGDWNSLEGAYFARVYDYKATMKAAEVAEGILRPWDNRWISTDWGKTHYCSSHWHGKTLLNPSEVKKWLGWDVPRPLNVVSTYRRMIVNEQTSTQVGKALVENTPVRERERVTKYFLSPEVFGDRDSENTTADLLTAELRRFGMPAAERADNARKVGWQLMYTLLNNTRIWATPEILRTPQMLAEAGDMVWVVSSECPEILDYLPLLMRNQKDLDDIVKTDTSQTDKKMDVADDVRYGLQSMLGAAIKPQKVVHGEQMMAAWERNHDPNQLTMMEIAYRAGLGNKPFSVTGRRR